MTGEGEGAQLLTSMYHVNSSKTEEGESCYSMTGVLKFFPMVSPFAAFERLTPYFGQNLYIFWLRPVVLNFNYVVKYCQINERRDPVTRSILVIPS